MQALSPVPYFHVWRSTRRDAWTDDEARAGSRRPVAAASHCPHLPAAMVYLTVPCTGGAPNSAATPKSSGAYTLPSVRGLRGWMAAPLLLFLADVCRLGHPQIAGVGTLAAVAVCTVGWLRRRRVVPRVVRDPANDALARVRYRLFGQKETCRMPTPAERDRFLG